MKELTHTDKKGRRWWVRLPDDVPDYDAAMGFVVGPAPLDELRKEGWPEAVLVRLHNQLHDRRILTLKDARTRRQDIFGAIQGALSVDTERVYQIYAEREDVMKGGEG